jgi:mRNA-degrading endonuclease RelE of RelBE toxin-antitoxin system
MELFIKSLFKHFPSESCQRHFDKAIAIEQSLNSSVDYQKLGGRKLTIAKGLIRFKLGHYRLIFKHTSSGFIAETLIPRKSLERYLKRR